MPLRNRPGNYPILTLATAGDRPAVVAALDRVAKQLVVFFVDSKFYTLFSFLFGLGFAIQLSRAAERGRAIVATYARRVTVLAVIGVLHPFCCGMATFY